MSKRKAIDRATDVRNAIIAGMWANTNLDDNKGTRRNALEEIQNNYDDTIEEIYSGIRREDIDLNSDPFFAAMKVPGQELLAKEQPPATVPDRTNTIDDLDSIGVDQA